VIPEQETYQQQLTRMRDEATIRATKAEADRRAAENELGQLRRLVAQLTEQRDEARMWARHGYEIGQRHCGWTDHGVAPAWLTDGWPVDLGSCETTARAEQAEARIAAVETVLHRYQGCASNTAAALRMEIREALASTTPCASCCPTPEAQP
jgi:hypothetical protein